MSKEVPEKPIFQELQEHKRFYLVMLMLVAGASAYLVYVGKYYLVFTSLVVGLGWFFAMITYKKLK